MQEVDLLFVKCGDWEALYVDGHLAEENHSLHISDVLEHLVGKTLVHSDELWVTDEWAQHCGGFPRDFSDIPDDAFEPQ